MCKPNTIRYEDIEKTSAETLLSLSYRELNKLIREAERRAHHANLVLNWLKGIKFEKSLRWRPADD